VNELELLASLRDEVPAQASSPIERAVMTAIRAQAGYPAGGPRRARAASPRRPAATGRPQRRSRLRPVLAGALAVAVAVGAGAYAAVRLSAHQAPGSPAGGQAVTWSGQPTAAWPAGPSYGRATTEAQLVDYVTRAAAAAPGRAPGPGEWVAVKAEFADSSKGSGGYVFGPPDERKITLTWYRADMCAAASVPAVPASLPPTSTVTGKLTVDTRFAGAGCGLFGSTLGGWKSTTYPYLESLPTDPAALESALLAGDPPGGLIPTREDAIFDAIYNLLTAGEPQGIVVPARLQAALYRVLQQLPGVHFETAADLAGRTGLGFWMVREGYLKEEVVIDPVTYAYMGYEDVAIKDHVMTGTDGTRHVAQGHVMGWGALLGSAIVAHPGQLP
jgi:hypothetical protein